jgi:hypothetical protein
MNEVLKIPLFVEVIGEPSAGKTDLSCRFPKPAVLDTTPKKECYAVMRKYLPDWKKRHFPIRSFEDIRTALKSVRVNPNDFKTVVVDTSADLRVLGSREYLDQLKKAGKDREALMPEEYKWVNAKVDALIDEVTGTGEKGMYMNLVFTSQMRDEWGADRKPTGRRTRKGYPDANFQADIRLFLQVTQKVDKDTMQYIEEYVRTCRVVKNRFRDQTNKEEWIPELKEFSWKGIVELAGLEAGEVVE